MRSRTRLIVQTYFESRFLIAYRWIQCFTSFVSLTAITFALVLKLLSYSDMSTGYVINILTVVRFESIPLMFMSVKYFDPSNNLTVCMCLADKSTVLYTVFHWIK
jgi:hypothetical protein